MKSRIAIVASTCLIISTGCAVSSAPTRLDAVGPLRITSKPHQPGEGVLTVYSDYINNPNDPSHPPHGDYQIYSPDGALLQTVHNRTGSFNQEPVACALRAGKYRIVAQAVNYGMVTIPIVVAENKNTIVDLNQELWSRQPADGEWVQLPNHHVVGRRAQ